MIEVGEYVRTNDGIIGKIKRIELDNIDKSLKWYIFDWKRPDINKIEEVYINKPYITKYSKNLIDLIEVGDIVEVLDYDWVRVFNIDDEDILESVIEDIQEGNWKLQGIMTKEVYEQNSYKVEGEE